MNPRTLSRSTLASALTGTLVALAALGAAANAQARTNIEVSIGLPGLPGLPLPLPPGVVLRTDPVVVPARPAPPPRTIVIERPAPPPVVIERPGPPRFYDGRGYGHWHHHGPVVWRDREWRRDDRGWRDDDRRDDRRDGWRDHGRDDRRDGDRGHGHGHNGRGRD